ncbi:hypothetical protein ABGB12_34870 [Actinocorallia sp. B10E7]|uniref:hypothetical protein n=1 Tax=Actinocorallia sp. B10E7 TaxID=3153558 RepID=UPI00325C696F
MRRVKAAVDAALGVALLVAVLMVATDAPVWLALLGTVVLPIAAFRSLAPDNDDTGDASR